MTARFRWFAVVVIALAAAAFYAPSLSGGLPIGDSHLFNISWALAFRDTLNWETPYPRWLPTLWGGAGGADLMFYAPLPFYLVAAVEALCPSCGIERSIAIAAMLLRVVAGAGTLVLAGALGLGRAALLAALFIVLSPYHVVDWLQRQAFGELSGAAFLPFFLWALHRTLTGRGWGWLTLSAALISLSHLPSLVIAGIGAALLISTAWRPACWRTVIVAAGAGALGLGLAAIYWLPAVLLLETVSTRHLWDIGPAFIDFAFWRWDARLIMLWAPFLALCLVSAALALLALPVGRERGRLIEGTIVALLGLSIVTVTILIRPIWESTLLRTIQFPWRFLMLADIGFALAVALAPVVWFAAQPLRRHVGRILILAGATIVALPLITWFQAPQKPTRFPWALEIRIGTLEWIGRAETVHGLDFLAMERDGPPPELTGQQSVVSSALPDAEFEVLDQSARSLRFVADCPLACEIVIHRTFWSLWTLTGPDGAPVPVRMSDGFPRLGATLPAGRAEYRLDLPRARPEIAGFWISMLSVFLYLTLVIRRHLARRHPDRKKAS